MTSERMIASNRRNGRRGRGPCTAAGKAVSSRNAMRHGLAVSLLNEPAMCAKVEALARAIAGTGANDARLGLARIAAAAQFDLARIRAAKVMIMNSQSAGAASDALARGDEVIPSLQIAEAGLGTDGPSTIAEEGQELGVLPSIEVSRQLLRLERYESSAFSRRRRAMCALRCIQPTGV